MTKWQEEDWYTRCSLSVRNRIPKSFWICCTKHCKKHLPTLKARCIRSATMSKFRSPQSSAVFSGDIRHWGRITVMFVLAIFVQQRFKIDLEEETMALTENLLSNWMKAQGDGTNTLHECEF